MTPPGPLHRLVERGGTVGAVARLLADSLLVGCLLRFARIGGRDRVLALAGQAFMTVVPLFILVASVGPGDDSLSRYLVERFDLTGNAADAVTSLFTRPPDSTSPVTVAGMAVLLFSLLTFTRSLQRTYEDAWELSPMGWRGTARGIAGVVLMLAGITAVALLSALLRRVAPDAVVLLLMSVPLAVVLWLQLQWLLLSGRVSHGLLLPGALVAGAGQVVTSVFSAAWMPRLISNNAERYGIIGVTFALLSWLIVLSAAIVATAVVSAEAGSRRPRGVLSGRTRSSG